jgi:hypothetical protein
VAEAQPKSEKAGSTAEAQEYAEIFYFKLFLGVLSASAVRYSVIYARGENLEVEKYEEASL